MELFNRSLKPEWKRTDGVVSNPSVFAFKIHCMITISMTMTKTMAMTMKMIIIIFL